MTPDGLCPICGGEHYGKGRACFMVVEDHAISELDGIVLALAFGDAVFHERCLAEMDAEGIEVMCADVSEIDLWGVEGFEEPRMAVPVEACKPVE